MKLLSNGQSMKRSQLSRLAKKTLVISGSSSSTVPSSSAVVAAIVVGKKKRKVGLVMRYVPKKWVYKFKAHLKQAAIGWHNQGSSTSRNHNYSYDIHSYSLNFDDGFCQ